MRLPGFPSSRVAWGWDDEPGDVLVARLQGLARGPVDGDERLARMRAQLRVAFADTQATRAAPSRPALPPRRLAFAFATTVLLVIVSVGGLSATAPGLPLYALRLSVETALLPTSPGDRLLVQLDRLDRRLDEAEAALQAGDSGGVAAALRAYEQIAGHARAGSSPPAAIQTIARARLRDQVQRLEALSLRTTVPEAAAALGSARAMLGWLLLPTPDTIPAGPQPTVSHAPAATTTMSPDRSVPGRRESSAPSGRPHASPDPSAGPGGGGGTSSSPTPGGPDPSDQRGPTGAAGDKGGP